MKSPARTMHTYSTSQSAAMLQGMHALAAKRSKYHGMPDESLMHQIKLLQEEIDRAEEEARKYGQEANENGLAATPLAFLAILAIPVPLLAIFLAIPALIFASNAMGASGKEAAQKRKARKARRDLAEAKAALGTEVKPEPQAPSMPAPQYAPPPPTVPPQPTQVTVNNPPVQAGMMAGGFYPYPVYPAPISVIQAPPSAPHTESKTEHYHSEKTTPYPPYDPFGAILKLIEAIQLNRPQDREEHPTVINNYYNNNTHHHHHYQGEGASPKNVTPAVSNGVPQDHYDYVRPRSSQVSVYDRVGNPPSSVSLYDIVGPSPSSISQYDYVGPPPYPSQPSHPLINNLYDLVSSQHVDIGRLKQLAEQMSREQAGLLQAASSLNTQHQKEKEALLAQVSALDQANQLIRGELLTACKKVEDTRQDIAYHMDAFTAQVKQFIEKSQLYVQHAQAQLTDQLKAQQAEFSRLLEASKEGEADRFATYQQGLVEKISKVERELDSLKEEKASKSQVAYLLPMEQPKESLKQLATLESRIAACEAYKETLDQHNQEIASLTERVNALEGNQNKAMGEGLAHIKASFNAHIEEMKSEMASTVERGVKTVMGGLLEAQKKVFEQRMAEIERTHQEKLTLHTSDLMSSLTQAHAAHLESMAKSRAEFATFVETQKAELSKLKEDVDDKKLQAHAEKVSAKLKALDEKITSFQDGVQGTEEQLNTCLAMKETLKSQEEEVSKLKQQLATIESSDKARDALLQQSITRMEGKLGEQWNAAEERVNKRLNAVDEKVKQHLSQFDTKTASLEERHAQQLKEIEAKYIEQYTNLAASHAEQLSTIQAEKEHLRSELTTALEEKNLEQQRLIQTQMAQIQEELAASKRAYEAKVEALEETVANLKNRLEGHENRLNTHDKDIKNLRESFESIQKSIDKLQGRLETDEERRRAVEELHKTVKSYKETVDSYKRERKEYKNERSAMAETISKLKVTIGNFEAENKFNAEAFEKFKGEMRLIQGKHEEFCQLELLGLGTKQAYTERESGIQAGKIEEVYGQLERVITALPELASDMAEVIVGDTEETLRQHNIRIQRLEARPDNRDQGGSIQGEDSYDQSLEQGEISEFFWDNNHLDRAQAERFIGSVGARNPELAETMRRSAFPSFPESSVMFGPEGGVLEGHGAENSHMRPISRSSEGDNATPSPVMQGSSYIPSSPDALKRPVPNKLPPKMDTIQIDETNHRSAKQLSNMIDTILQNGLADNRASAYQQKVTDYTQEVEKNITAQRRGGGKSVGDKAIKDAIDDQKRADIKQARNLFLLGQEEDIQEPFLSILKAASTKKGHIIPETVDNIREFRKSLSEAEKEAIRADGTPAIQVKAGDGRIVRRFSMSVNEQQHQNASPPSSLLRSASQKSIHSVDSGIVEK